MYAVQKNDQFLKQSVESLPNTEWLSCKTRTCYLKSLLTAGDNIKLKVLLKCYYSFNYHTL